MKTLALSRSLSLAIVALAVSIPVSLDTKPASAQEQCVGDCKNSHPQNGATDPSEFEKLQHAISPESNCKGVLSAEEEGAIRQGIAAIQQDVLSDKITDQQAKVAARNLMRSYAKGDRRREAMITAIGEQLSQPAVLSKIAKLAFAQAMGSPLQKSDYDRFAKLNVKSEDLDKAVKAVRDSMGATIGLGTKLHQAGAKYNSKDGSWDISKVKMTADEVAAGKPLNKAMTKFLGETIGKSLSDPNRKTAVRAGNYVFLPPQGSDHSIQMMSIDDWKKGITASLAAIQQQSITFGKLSNASNTVIETFKRGQNSSENVFGNSDATRQKDKADQDLVFSLMKLRDQYGAPPDVIQATGKQIIALQNKDQAGIEAGYQKLKAATVAIISLPALPLAWEAVGAATAAVGLTGSAGAAAVGAMHMSLWGLGLGAGLTTVTAAAEAHFQGGDFTCHLFNDLVEKSPDMVKQAYEGAAFGSIGAAVGGAVGLAKGAEAGTKAFEAAQSLTGVYFAGQQAYSVAFHSGPACVGAYQKWSGAKDKNQVTAASDAGVEMTQVCGQATTDAIFGFMGLKELGGGISGVRKLISDAPLGKLNMDVKDVFRPGSKTIAVVKETTPGTKTEYVTQIFGTEGYHPDAKGPEQLKLFETAVTETVAAQDAKLPPAARSAKHIDVYEVTPEGETPITVLADSKGTSAPAKDTVDTNAYRVSETTGKPEAVGKIGTAEGNYIPEEAVDAKTPASLAERLATNKLYAKGDRVQMADGTFGTVEGYAADGMAAVMSDQARGFKWFRPSHHPKYFQVVPEASLVPREFAFNRPDAMKTIKDFIKTNSKTQQGMTQSQRLTAATALRGQNSAEAFDIIRDLAKDAEINGDNGALVIHNAFLGRTGPVVEAELLKLASEKVPGAKETYDVAVANRKANEAQLAAKKTEKNETAERPVTRDPASEALKTEILVEAERMPVRERLSPQEAQTIQDALDSMEPTERKSIIDRMKERLRTKPKETEEELKKMSELCEKQ